MRNQVPQSNHHANVQILAGRLNTGWVMCERETDLQHKAHLEDHWINVLHQYEAACDQESASIDASAQGVAA